MEVHFEGAFLSCVLTGSHFRYFVFKFKQAVLGLSGEFTKPALLIKRAYCVFRTTAAYCGYGYDKLKGIFALHSGDALKNSDYKCKNFFLADFIKIFCTCIWVTDWARFSVKNLNFLRATEINQAVAHDACIVPVSAWNYMMIGKYHPIYRDRQVLRASLDMLRITILSGGRDK